MDPRLDFPGRARDALLPTATATAGGHTAVLGPLTIRRLALIHSLETPLFYPDTRLGTGLGWLATGYALAADTHARRLTRLLAERGAAAVAAPRDHGRGAVALARGLRPGPRAFRRRGRRGSGGPVGGILAAGDGALAELAGWAMTELGWGWDEALDAPLPAILLARRHARRSAGRDKGFGWAMMDELERRKRNDGD